MKEMKQKQSLNFENCSNLCFQCQDPLLGFYSPKFCSYSLAYLFKMFS